MLNNLPHYTLQFQVFPFRERLGTQRFYIIQNKHVRKGGVASSRAGESRLNRGTQYPEFILLVGHKPTVLTTQLALLPPVQWVGESRIRRWLRRGAQSEEASPHTSTVRTLQAALPDTR